MLTGIIIVPWTQRMLQFFSIGRNLLAPEIEYAVTNYILHAQSAPFFYTSHLLFVISCNQRKSTTWFFLNRDLMLHLQMKQKYKYWITREMRNIIKQNTVQVFRAYLCGHYYCSALLEACHWLPGCKHCHRSGDGRSCTNGGRDTQWPGVTSGGQAC